METLSAQSHGKSLVTLKISAQDDRSLVSFISDFMAISVCLYLNGIKPAMHYDKSGRDSKLQGPMTQYANDMQMRTHANIGVVIQEIEIMSQCILSRDHNKPMRTRSNIRLNLRTLIFLFMVVWFGTSIETAILRPYRNQLCVDFVSMV